MNEDKLNEFEDEAELYARKAINEFNKAWYEADTTDVPMLITEDDDGNEE